MRIPRIYCHTPMSLNTELLLTDDLAHRLRHVLRLNVGDQIALFNGDGEEYRAEIIACQRKTVSVLLKDKHPLSDRESPLKLHLIQGIAKGDTMDWILQKACELGVQEITPLLSQHAQLKQSEKKLNQKAIHWQKVIIHACEQCGRGNLPTLNHVSSFKDLLSNVATLKSAYFLSIDGDPLDKITIDFTQNLTILVGPEGGFSNEETQFMRENHLKAIKLGPRILRTETASLSLLSILQYFYGDLMGSQVS